MWTPASPLPTEGRMMNQVQTPRNNSDTTPQCYIKHCSKVGKTDCELDTAIGKFKLKPLAKVCEWPKK